VDGGIKVSDTVIKSIVGQCAREVPGVFALSATKYQNLVSWGAQAETRGIDVQPGPEEGSKRIDLRIIVEQGQPIPTVAENLQRSVKEVVEKMTGLDVSEVNVFVDDVRDHLERELPVIGEEAESSSTKKKKAN